VIKGFAGRDYATTGELAERLCIRSDRIRYSERRK
jgi:hypothetical protein